MKLSKEEKSWILYDVGNSAFVLVMVTAVMPIFFKDVAAAGLSNAVATANWGFANAAASFTLALAAPVMGTLADYRHYKMRLFSVCLGMGLMFTGGLVFMDKGMWRTCLVLFVLARVGWAGANLFYDAAVTDITTPDRMDRISTMGYAWGYIGSVIPFLVIIALIMTAPFTGNSGGGAGGTVLPIFETRLGFVVVLVWWFSFAIPMLRHVRQRHFLQPTPSPVIESFRRLFHTFQEIRDRHRKAFLFLGAYFFYIDGVGTIISMSSAYGRDLGFSATLLIVVILFIQVTAFPFALVFGRLAEKFSTQAMLMAGIFIYCIITGIAFFLPAIHDPGIQTAVFWFIAFLVAASMGGVQALSRSYYASLIPPERSGQFFGFYNVFGKFAAVTGPFLMGVLGHLTGETRWGVLSLLLLFSVGAFLLWKTGKTNG